MIASKPRRALRLDALLAAAGTWLLPLSALACPVCFSAKDEASRVAFLGTTVFLTALPLLLVGAVIYWLAGRSAQLAKLERDELAQATEAEAQAGEAGSGVLTTR